MSAPAIPDLTGRKIGEYEIVQRIGVGGMGAVYEGRQPMIGKRVAVKVLLPALSNEKELVERFLAEARAVNEIRHRGIVDIFSMGQLPEGAHYFVMEFLEGEAFDKIIKKRAPLSIAEALVWVDEMLDALDAAHSAGIIHRDIKPSNLFLVNTGRGRPYIKLLDFGIAKLGVLQGEATPQTRASVILGTPDYISPEQARGQPISPQTDLYALGCVLFEMVTGDRVFRGENTLQTMWMHVEDQPPAPSVVRPDIPKELDDAILWALQKKPSDRPPSAAAFRDQLALIRATYSPTGQLTPIPFSSSPSGSRPLSNTPPPSSGRSRPLSGPLSGTPAPRSGAQAPLKTPQPSSKSGNAQASLSGRSRVSQPNVTAPGVAPALGDAPPPETRLAPLTAMTGAQLAPEVSDSPPSLQMDVDVEPQTDAAVPTTSKSKLPLVLAGVVLLLIVAVVVVVVMPSGGGTTTPEDPSNPTVLARNDKNDTPPKVDQPKTPDVPKNVDPPKTPDVPVAVDTPKNIDTPKTPDVPVAVDTPKTPDQPQNPNTNVDTPKTPDKPKNVDMPKKKGITTEQLAARLKKIENQLASKEAETGQKDNVVRQFLDQAKKQIQRANTDSERREAWGFLGDIEAQLKH
ncbi:MAG: protein kinase [Archangium sp.]|nr:protein kinase [Archangium sp.]